MTLTVTAVAGFGTAPLVSLSVASSPSVTDRVAIYRTHEDGSSHRVILEDGATLIGSFVGVDYHAPFNQLVTYRAVSGGLTSAESAAVVVSSQGVWLMHPTDPALSVMVEKLVGPAADYTYPTRASRSQVLNSRLPRFRSDFLRGGESGQLVVKCEDNPTPAQMKALLDDDSIVLLNTPYGDDDLGWKWIKPLDLVIRNPGGFMSFPFRYAVIPYEEAEQLDFDQRIRTYAEAEADFPTEDYADMALVYATYADARLDVRLP